MTDLWNGALLDCRVWHARSGDVRRDFRYSVTCLALPVARFEAGALPIRPDARGLWSVRPRDYGHRDGQPLSRFIAGQLDPAGLGHCEVTLVTLPRSPGYGFNPVSFWLARDSRGLRAVLAEVSNTFGERHFYLCRHADNRPIGRSDRISGEKIFHVSPFLPREGRYVFRFDPGPDRFGAWVDWIGEGGEVKLQTSMAGPARPLTAGRLARAQWRHAFQAQKVIALIHWQALKLALRGVRFNSKPRQLAQTVSEANDGVRQDV
ncbi:DUF1365 domain-containing protein [Salipiger sp. P9]|uniref:DUF1365 domain-containing protein n=1 Tax=Salipiger pentaromativorans TaxID=2943193 RepID=UPI002157121E|nr:DUF1365 domain-containing protein [Salipiger pentaromativorans]MCR8550309.1 DUF1365 domain-containing protein [Salipiger pentaromativorans]